MGATVPESVLTRGAPASEFGPGAADEVGFDLARLGARRALVVTDAGVAATGAPQRAAGLLVPGAERPDGPAEHLPAANERLMRDLGLPDGIGGVGCAEGDVPALAAGTVRQQRLPATAPRPVTGDDVAGTCARSPSPW